MPYRGEQETGGDFQEEARRTEVVWMFKGEREKSSTPH